MSRKKGRYERESEGGSLTRGAGGEGGAKGERNERKADRKGMYSCVRDDATCSSRAVKATDSYRSRHLIFRVETQLNI